jgi:hypothetical protein
VRPCQAQKETRRSRQPHLETMPEWMQATLAARNWNLIDGNAPVKSTIAHLKCPRNDLLPWSVMPRNSTRHRCITQDRPGGPGRDIAFDCDVFLIGCMVQHNLRWTGCVHLSNRADEVAKRRPPCATEEKVRQCLLLLWPVSFIYVADNAPQSARFIVVITPYQHD